MHVGVHDGHIVALRVAESGVHGGFLSEVPRKGKILNPFILRRQLAHHLERSILGSVVDQQKRNAVIRQLSGNVANGVIKNRKRFFLVITGNDQRYGGFHGV